jgi:hypothetical protein
MAVLQEAAASPVRHADGEPGGWWRLGRGVLLPLGFAVLATVGWEILCRVVRISPLLLPPPCAVWMVLSQNYEILLQHALPIAACPADDNRNRRQFRARDLARGRARGGDHLLGLGARSALPKHRHVPADPEDRAGAAVHRLGSGLAADPALSSRYSSRSFRSLCRPPPASSAPSPRCYCCADR